MPELSRSLRPRHVTMISIGGIIGAGLFVGSSASIALAGPAIVHGWLGLPTWLLGIVLMAIMTAVNLMSARSYGEFEFWFASIKVAAIVVFIALAAAFAFGYTSPTGPTFANLTHYGGFMPKGWVSVLAGAVTVYFSLTGAEITTIAAAESSEPARAVARLSSSVIVRILTFYVGSVLLIVTVVPWIEVRPGESPFTLALTTMHFRWASLAMSAIILTAVLSCLNSAFYVCSRVLFVLAEHGDAPQWLVQLNERRVPSRSVWIGGLAGVLGILAAINYPQTVFAFLVNASGALMVFIYMIVTLAHIRLRRAREARGEPEPALTMWLFPWASYAALGGMAAVLIAMAFTPGELTTELRVSVLALAVAVVAYLIVDARRGGRATHLNAAIPPAERP